VAGEQTPDLGNFRRYLFGDVPLDEWPPDTRDDDRRDGEPWESFIQARQAARSQRMKDAVEIWQSIAARHDAEPRHVLQAWHFLRQAGTQPGPDIASRVLGTVAEVAVPAGHDVLACYRHGSVRYLNFSGSVIVYEDGNAQVDAAIAGLLDVSQAVADAIGVWERPQLPALPDGHTRFMMLAPAGARFGQGPDAAMRTDRVANALLSAATKVLTVLTKAASHS
jgi:hypothetical protein